MPRQPPQVIKRPIQSSATLLPVSDGLYVIYVTAIPIITAINSDSIFTIDEMIS
jgi:hypothetical protein